MSPATLTRPAWTEEHESTVRDMRAAGASAGTIARALTDGGLPVSRSAVLGKIYRLKLPVPAASPVESVAIPEALAVEDAPPPALLAPEPRPTAAPVEALPFVPPAGRSLLDLPARGCRYAVGQDGAGRHLFCGEPSVAKKSWCPDHFLIVFSAHGMGGMSLAQERESGRVPAAGGTR